MSPLEVMIYIGIQELFESRMLVYNIRNYGDTRPIDSAGKFQ